MHTARVCASLDLGLIVRKSWLRLEQKIVCPYLWSLHNNSSVSQQWSSQRSLPAGQNRMKFIPAEIWVLIKKDKIHIYHVSQSVDVLFQNVLQYLHRKTWCNTCCEWKSKMKHQISVRQKMFLFQALVGSIKSVNGPKMIVQWIWVYIYVKKIRHPGKKNMTII